MVVSYEILPFPADKKHEPAPSRKCLKKHFFCQKIPAKCFLAVTEVSLCPISCVSGPSRGPLEFPAASRPPACLLAATFHSAGPQRASRHLCSHLGTGPGGKRRGQGRWVAKQWRSDWSRVQVSRLSAEQLKETVLEVWQFDWLAEGYNRAALIVVCPCHLIGYL